MEWLWVILSVIGIAMLIVAGLTFLILVFAAVEIAKGSDDIHWRR